MSAPQKLKAGDNSELTRFKGVWRDLSDDTKSYWRALFISDTSQAEIRRLVRSKLKINLSFDKQLTYFRKWLDEQDARDLEAQRQVEDEQRLIAQYGDKRTTDEIRNLVLKASYERTLATGDFKLGLAALHADRGLMEAKTTREKFEFDAAKAALKHAVDLKTISNDKSLSESDKVNLARQKLFGVVPT